MRKPLRCLCGRRLLDMSEDFEFEQLAVGYDVVPPDGSTDGYSTLEIVCPRCKRKIVWGKK